MNDALLRVAAAELENYALKLQAHEVPHWFSYFTAVCPNGLRFINEALPGFPLVEWWRHATRNDRDHELFCFNSAYMARISRESLSRFRATTLYDSDRQWYGLGSHV